MQMSHTGCVIAGYMASLCMVATTFSIAAITVNRYIRVCHGRKYNKCCASGGIATTIACVWLAAALLVVPLADGWSTVKYTPDTFFCIAQCDTKVYCAIRLTLAISIPLLVMVICYGCIIKHVYNSKRGPRRTEEGQLASPHVSHLTHLRCSLDSNKLWWWRRVSLSMTVEPADIGLSQTSHTVPSTMPHPSGYNSESPVHLSLEDPIIEETEEDLQHYLECPKPSSPNLSFLGLAVNSMKSAEICQPVKLKDSLLKLKQLRWVQEEIQLITSIGIIIGVYIFSYIPVVTMLNISKAYEGLIPKEIVVISVLVLYANSIYNPIIYGARNRNIREGYIKLLAGTNRRTENISA